MKKMRLTFGATGMVLSFAVSAVWAGDNIVGGGPLITLNNNGAWSWFQDERAIMDGSKLLVSSIANASGLGGSARDGNVDVVGYDFASRRRTFFTLADIVPDDHNSAALMIRPDGKYLAVYGNHGSDNLTRWRVSSNPGDATNWGAEQTYNNGIGATYNNVFRLAAEGKTYNFTRTNGYDPNFLVSSDDGSNWTYGGYLLRDPAGSSSGRPYVKYASDGQSRIYFLTTEQHPRDNNNGVYAGYMESGKLYRMDGSLVGNPGTNVATAPSATTFTTVMAPNTVIDGETRTHGWTTDMALDATGKPYAIFTGRVASNSNDHRFYYARWTGTQWSVNELAKAGGFLYSAENDYTGLAALDPDNPDVVYISSKISPITQATLSKYEIFKGTTTDGGASWEWNAVTVNSTVDNLRPVMPKGDGGSKTLVWMRGNYTTYTNYDLSVVALELGTGAGLSGKVTYVDATEANTAAVSGGVWNDGSPTGTQGATDNRWHLRTGFGNGAGVWTTDELASENAPALVTTITGVAQGKYDVFAFIWSNVNEQWEVQAGLDSGSLMLVDRLGLEGAVLEELTGAMKVTDSGATLALYRVYLGRQDVGSDGLLRVFIDDGTGSVGSRTWFDGIGYAAVPEPGVMGVCGLVGVLALMKRRRM